MIKKIKFMGIEVEVAISKDPGIDKLCVDMKSPLLNKRFEFSLKESIGQIQEILDYLKA